LTLPPGILLEMTGKITEVGNGQQAVLYGNSNRTQAPGGVTFILSRGVMRT